MLSLTCGVRWSSTTHCPTTNPGAGCNPPAMRSARCCSSRATSSRRRRCTLPTSGWIRRSAGPASTRAMCGACTVIVKGEAVRSCVTPVKDVEGSEITTLEGLGTPAKPHPIQQAFIEEQASQCGFCVNGVIMTAKAFLDKNPKATDVQIQQALSGVLCRCFTHVRMHRAIKRYAQEKA